MGYTGDGVGGAGGTVACRICLCEEENQEGNISDESRAHGGCTAPVRVGLSVSLGFFCSACSVLF